MSACDGKGTTDPEPTPAIQLAVGATSLQVQQGASGSLGITITRSGGFSGAVTVTAEGLPAGVTAAPLTINSGQTQGVLNVAVDGAAAPATANVTIRATGAGVTAQTATVALTTTVRGSFTIAAGAGVTAVQGANADVAVTLTRNGGFAGNVALTATAPAGITAVFTPTSLTGSESTAMLRLTPSATMAPGSYSVTITGTTPGLAPQTATANLTVTAAGGFSIALTPTSLSLVQGASGNATLAVTRTGAFTGPVAVTATAPAGITATVTPASVTGASATVAITAAANAAPGTHTVTLRGTAAGLPDQTVNLAVTVTAAPVASIALALTPATLTLQQGASGTSAVAITRSNFTGSVQLTATAPAGITATLTPADVTGTTSTLNVTVGAAVAPGNHTITVRGTGSGITEQTASLTVTVTAAPVGSFALALTPSAISVQQGAAGTSTVGITRSNFTGNVALTATAPAGITATLTPADVSGTSSTLNVAVGAAVAPGSYTVTVRGTGTGVAEQSVSLGVTVTAAPVGGFTMALGTGVIAVVPGGGSGSVPLTLTRSNYTADINLTATGQPPGVTVSFNPATVSGTSSTISVTAAGSVAPGSYPVVIRANGAGVTERTAELLVTVQNVGPGNVTWTFCGLTGIPVWVAAQDGNGAWTQVPLSGGSYTFQINSGRGGIAYVTPAVGGGFDTDVWYGTTAELQQQGTDMCFGSNGAGKTVNGTATGLAAVPLPEQGFITLGRSQAQLVGTNGAFTLTGVLDGSLDLIAAKLAFGGTGFLPASFQIQRNLNVPNNGSVGTINFANGFAPATSTLTFANAGSDLTGSTGLYFTPRNTMAVLYTEGFADASATRTWYGFPAAQRQAGELHLINAIATDPATLGGSTNFYTRQVMFLQADVAPKTVTLGPILAVPTVSTAATAPYLRLRLDFTIVPEYNRAFTAFFQQGSAASARSFTIQKTDNFISAGGATAMEIPDFSTVSGWDNTWALVRGILTTWGLTATGFTGGGLGTPVLVEGAELKSGTRQGTITP